MRRKEDDGDANSAFLTVFDAHAPDIHAYLTRRVGSDPANDLLADVWIAAYKSRHRYEGEWSEARPWLYGIARYTVFSYWRKYRAPITGSIEVSNDPWPAVEDCLNAKELGPLLYKAIQALPGNEREVLLLTAWEELSPTEIALVLDVPAGTIRSRLHRAREFVKCQLEAPSLEPEVSQFSLRHRTDNQGGSGHGNH
jgi:RNA polymerase sigma-70 factor (ECF subfamily)